MTYLSPHSAKKYKSILPEASVALVLVLAFYGHMVPPNAEAQT